MPATYTNVKRRIEDRMEAIGIDNHADLAKKLSKKGGEDIPSSNIHNWGNRGSIPVKYLFLLANILECSPEWLMSGDNKYTNLPSKKSAKQVSIPIYRGQGKSLDEAEQGESLTVDEKWFCDMTGLDYRESYRIVKSSGDSMQPTINSGDMVLIDIASAKEGGDGMYYIQHFDRSDVKRLSFSGDTLHILSDSNKYPPKLVESKLVELIGQVKYIFNGSRV